MLKYLPMQEKTIRGKKIFSGRLINLRTLKVRLPDGNITTREIVYHPGAVAIVPILPGNKIILVKQYRKAVEQELLEIPAGTLEPGETPIRCAKRELIEETGYKAKKIRKILEFYPAPGYTSEKIHIFVATDIKKIKSKCESDEFIKTIILTGNQLKRLFKRGRIKDSKTLIALACLNLI